MVNSFNKVFMGAAGTEAGFYAGGDRGLFSGGRVTSNATAQNTIDYITISTTGNASDFGDLATAMFSNAACSDSHGGLS